MTYDAFIVHASADEAFVQGYLLPALGVPPERVLLSSKLDLGCTIASELERGVRTSRTTIAVLSPAFMTDRWAVFGEELATYVGVAKEVGGQLVPLIREECELPIRISGLVKLDFQDPEQWSSEAKRLRDFLERPTPVESPLACPYPGMRPFTENDASYFYGRDNEVEQLINLLRMGEREIFVIGPSGSGKSSLIAAGLLPRLAQGVAQLAGTSKERCVPELHQRHG